MGELDMPIRVLVVVLFYISVSLLIVSCASHASDKQSLKSEEVIIFVELMAKIGLADSGSIPQTKEEMKRVLSTEQGPVLYAGSFKERFIDDALSRIQVTRAQDGYVFIILAGNGTGMRGWVADGGDGVQIIPIHASGISE